MKAITCTQCGATLENVSERSKIVECEYCGAQIMFPKPEPTVYEPVEPPRFGLQVESRPPLSAHKVGTIAALGVLIPMMVILFIALRRPQPGTIRASSAATPYATPYVGSTPSSWSWNANANTSAKPFPVVNYQPRVSWDGANDMEHFEDPVVDLSSVSDLTSEEVAKTVFKNRNVKLRVVINTEGEIDEVETISGHPILVAAATQSAKSSIFASRSKPTKRVLTYTFRVLKD